MYRFPKSMRGDAAEERPSSSSKTTQSDAFNLESISRSSDDEEAESLAGPSDQRRPLLSTTMADDLKDVDVGKRGSVGIAHHAEAVWNDEARGAGGGAYVPRGR